VANRLFGFVKDAAYGQHHANWLSACAYYGEVLRCDPTRLSGFLDLAKSTSWALRCRHVCFVSERHNVSHRDAQHRLHCDDGPAVLYPDGWGVWAGTTFAFLDGSSRTRRLFPPGNFRRVRWPTEKGDAYSCRPSTFSGRAARIRCRYRPGGPRDGSQTFELEGPTDRRFAFLHLPEHPHVLRSPAGFSPGPHLRCGHRLPVKRA